MPMTSTVKINSIDPTTRGNFNYLEVKGYDSTNSKPFKKLTFETTKSGDLTKISEALQGVSNGDWVEITMDDSKYNNITQVKKCAAPAGGEPPANSGGGGGAKSGGGGGDAMSKAEWAEKDRKKEVGVARSVAIKAAVAACAADHGKVTKARMEQIEKMSLRMEAFLLTGDFDGDVSAPVVSAPKTEEAPPIDNDTPLAEDDDIPF